MSTASERTREIIEIYVEANRSGDTSSLGRIIAPGFRYMPSPPIGVEGVVAAVRVIHAGFSQITIALEQCLCEGDRAAFRFVIAGTHTGVFAGRPPTGRRITWSGADFVRLEGDKMVEIWAVQDSTSLREGIGALVRAPA